MSNLDFLRDHRWWFYLISVFVCMILLGIREAFRIKILLDEKRIRKNVINLTGLAIGGDLVGSLLFGFIKIGIWGGLGLILFLLILLASCAHLVRLIQLRFPRVFFPNNLDSIQNPTARHALRQIAMHFLDLELKYTPADLTRSILRQDHGLMEAIQNQQNIAFLEKSKTNQQITKYMEEKELTDDDLLEVLLKAERSGQSKKGIFKIFGDPAFICWAFENDAHKKEGSLKWGADQAIIMGLWIKSGERPS